MRKQIFIFFVVGIFAFPVWGAKITRKSTQKPAKADPAPTAPAKPLKLAAGSDWILTKDLTLQKTGLTPEEFVPYTSVWDLKKKTFMRTSSSSSDSCEFRTTISKNIFKAPSVKVKKAAAFRVTNIQETTMSILIDATARDAKKSGIDQIQITCSAYEQGLDSPDLKEKFKADMGASLASVFAGKN
ncbi:MAG: hypothetical protein JSU04_17465 [Bdellovibrionales bacterium]|nr:hypothetical protein [Bdellovibrionales bacterium]